MPEILGRARAPGHAATHALVVGVSHYPFAAGPQPDPRVEEFGLEDLPNAALSASQFAAWLLNGYRNPDAPLTSLHLLLSPTQGERLHPAVARLVGPRLPELAATREAVEADMLEFSTYCQQDTRDVALVYIAGHGVQVSKLGSIVLLEDFGRPTRANLFYGALDTVGCLHAMNSAGFADSQFWFVDACRQPVPVVPLYENLADAFVLDEGQGRVDCAIAFLAASTREAAFADVRGTSLFSQALIWALRGAAATGPSDTCREWHVTPATLLGAVQKRVATLAAAFDERQHVDSEGSPGSGVVQRLSRPPLVDLSIAIDPEQAAALATPELRLGGRTKIAIPPGWPIVGQVRAGLYTLAVAAPEPYLSVTLPLDVMPPEHSDIARVEP